MLEMRFGYPSVARTTGTEYNSGLRNRPLHASPGRTLFSKLMSLLTLTRPLLGFKMRLRKQNRERPPFLMIVCAEGDDRTDRAIGMAELNFHHRTF